MATNGENETEVNGTPRDTESQPVPEPCSADVPAKPKRKYRAPPSEPGVYLLFLNKRLVYVGRSDNPVRRVRTHQTNGRQFDYSVIVPVDVREVGWVEAALIEALNPPQNRRGVSTAPDSELAFNPVPPPPEKDPDVALSPSHVADSMRRYALEQDFNDAVKSGEVPSFTATSGRSKKLWRYVRSGDVDEWRERKLNERRGWREYVPA